MLTELFCQEGGTCKIICVNPGGELTPDEARVGRMALIEGEIFVPSLLVDPDKSLVTLAARIDGVRSVYADGDLWVPADWVEKQLSSTGDLIVLFREYVGMVRKLLAVEKS